MEIPRIALLAAAAFLTSCAAFGGDPAVQMRESENMPATRWQGTLSSPQSLSGAVEMTGTAWMGRDEDRGETLASVTIRNAAPSGRHPWAVHEGRCGADRGVYGSADDLELLEVDDDGRASSTGRIGAEMRDSGDYFVAVYASPTNRQLVVACANLAPPTGS